MDLALTTELGSAETDAKSPSQFLRIVFWNVGRRDRSDLVCAMADSLCADVVVLCESGVSSDSILWDLRQKVSKDFYIPVAVPDGRFQCYCRNASLDMSEVHDGFRFSFRRCVFGNHTLLLALIHGADIRNHDSGSRNSEMQSFAGELKSIKDRKRIEKIAILGDFNMNPYDRVMNLAAGLNAMMTKACVSAGARTYQSKLYDFYYNPMWSLFGDNTDGPAGTFHDTSSQGPYGWSMLDQVVIHHTLVPLFHKVEILTMAGEHSLMNTKGFPCTKTASDHFPILVSFRGGNDE